MLTLEQMNDKIYDKGRRARMNKYFQLTQKEAIELVNMLKMYVANKITK